MNDCQDVTMREALPELLHGRLPDGERRRVETHLSDCVDCTEEMAILEAVLASAPAPAVDVTRIVAAIPAYGAGAVSAVVPGLIPLRPRGMWSSRASRLQLAAALAIAAVGISTAAVVAHERGQSQAAVVTTRVPTQAPGVALVATADLSDAELATLIDDMKSLRALPPADPEPIAPVVDGGV